MSDLTVEIGGVRFKNPVAAASGDPTGSCESMEKAVRAGAGAARMERAGCHILELDAGCPFPDELDLCERDRELVRSRDISGLITERIKQVVKIPVIYKATPQVSSVLEMAEAVHAAGGGFEIIFIF